MQPPTRRGASAAWPASSGCRVASALRPHRPAAAFPALLLAAAAATAAAPSPPPSAATLAVDASASAGAVAPLLWAAFIEDIGHSVTGGLHAELVSDGQTRGPFAGRPAGAPPRVSLGATSAANAGRALRLCGGALMATLDGSGDATFEWLAPGLSGAAGTASLRAVYMANTGSVAGTFVVVAADGTLSEAAPDFASAAFNASATFTAFELAGGAVALAATAPLEREGWLLASGALYASPCGWLGDTARVGLVPPEGPPVPPPVPGDEVAWALLPPRQPDGAAWALEGGGASGAFVPIAPGDGPNANATSLLSISLGGSGGNGSSDAACNAGYFGMSVVANASYRLSAWVRSPSAVGGVAARFTLESADRAVAYAAFETPALAPHAWTRVAATLVAGASDANSTARLCVGLGAGGSGSGGGTLEITAVSLQPAAAAAGGMRPDLAALLAAMRPAALRFPGGCFVEGLNATTAFNFSTSVGPADERAGHYNLWGYLSHDFAGLLEYLLLAESLGAAPVWVLNAGAYYGGGSDPDVGTWVEHALALLEYAMGDAESGSYWAARRAADGHPAPFNLTHVAIGNENSGIAYRTHYRAIAAALRAAWPGRLTLIANEAFAGGDIDLVDLHVYAPTPEYFFAHQADLDAMPRGAGQPGLFVSEYATKGGSGHGNLAAALAEAAWMVGIERNSDLARLACYAPLLTHARDETWLPDAVTFDSDSRAGRAFGSPSYWVQAMFAGAAAAGDSLLAYNASAPLNETACGAPSALALRGPFANTAAALAASATLSAPAGAQRFLTLKLVNSCSAPRALGVSLAALPPGWAAAPGAAATTSTLTSAQLLDENSFATPLRVAPAAGSARVGADGRSLALELPPNAVVIVRVPLQPSAL